MNGLKFIRTRCNISLSELADVLSVSRQQISAWENGVKPISHKRLSQLSKYFGVDEKYIVYPADYSIHRMKASGNGFDRKWWC